MKDYQTPTDPRDVDQMPWGWQLKYYRERAGVTQDNLGGIPYDETGDPVFPNGNVSVSNLERLAVGKVPPPYAKAIALANFLKMDDIETYKFILTARKECAPIKTKVYDIALSKLKTKVICDKKNISKEMTDVIVALQELNKEELKWLHDTIKRIYPSKS